ncbi:MAG: aminotransferase class V-fold PLP-dependent enzyme [Clostridia bacterium]|nr:aminotransferase class V-fold PLP-dependent enzyme [Clostridia bacterium]
MIYLDNSATSFPKPREVREKMNECLKRYCANPGRSGHKMSLKISEEVYACREKLSDMFNVGGAERVIFTANTTGALNLAIKGTLRRGGHVIFTSMEHNSVVRPIYKLGETKGVDYSIANANIYGYVAPKSVEVLIRPDTQLIVAIHASNVCGTVNPIAEIGVIAKKHNIPFLVDAAQSGGILPIDMEKDNISMLALAGHKALYGPMGTGALCIGKGVNIDTLTEGGTGSNSQDPRQPEELPDKYESGTVNAVGICGLSKGIDFINRVGMETIYNHDMMLTRVMLEDLSVIKGVKIHGYVTCADRLGVVSVTIDGLDCVEAASILDEKYGIAVRAGYHCSYMAHATLDTRHTGTVRLSVGAFNSIKDIKTAVAAINEMSK